MGTISVNDVFLIIAEETVKETETMVQPIVEVTDYTEQININTLNENINFGFMFTVFFIGIITGVLLGKILWARVNI